MVYKSEETLYKFVSPTTMVFRYKYDLGQLKNLILLKGVGELKDGNIIFSSRFGLITPGFIFLLMCANFLYMEGAPDAQDIVGAILTLVIGISYFFYCRMAADKLPMNVVENLSKDLNIE
jgi:hypothetical protein